MWGTVTVGEICQIRTGKKDVNTGNPDGQYPFFTCAKENTFSDEYSFDTEALLIAGNGDVGRVIYYKGKFEAYQRTYVLDKFNKVLPRLLYHILQIELPIELDKKKQGSTIPYIRVGMLQKFVVPLPPISEQKKIVAKLESIEKLIRVYQEQIEDVISLKKVLLSKYFISNANEYKREELGNLCDIINGSTPYRQNPDFWNGDIRWFTIDDMRQQGRDINFTNQSITSVALEKTGIKMIPKNTVLLCCTASIGASAIARISLTTNQQFNALIPKENNLLPEFLYYVTEILTETLLGISGSVTINFIAISKLKKVLIPCPALEEQKRIVNELEAIDKLVNIRQAQIEELNSLKAVVLRRELQSEAA